MTESKHKWWLLLVAFGLALLSPPCALGLPQRGHTFSFAFGEAGKGSGQFQHPSGIALNQATGDVYVADRKNKVVEQFAPQTTGGELSGESFVRSLPVRAPSAVAVDNSGAASDPSRGDVYVVGNAGNQIYKFTAEGAPIGEPMRKVEIPEAGGIAKSKLEGIEGIAVDASGSLYVYVQSGTIFVLSNAVENEGVLKMAGCPAHSAAPGFALSSAGDPFVGLVGEGSVPTVAEIQAGSCNVLLPALSSGPATAVAVNRTDALQNLVDERDNVYVAIAGAGQGAIVQLAPGVEAGVMTLVQRLTHNGMMEPTGVAVDEQAGVVYVSDGASANVDVFELEPAGAPAIAPPEAAAAIPAEVDARTLIARVDPAGAPTQYSFEYGGEACTAGTCLKTPPSEAGSAFGDVEVTLPVSHLTPGTYHYRVSAENQFGATTSAERLFTIVAVAKGLPDGRDWELVTPVDKHGAPVEAMTREGGLILASETGDAFTYVANGAVTEEPQGNRSPEMQQVLATRTPSGWNSEDIATPQSAARGIASGLAPEYGAFSSDLSLALVEPFGAEPPLAPSPPKEPLYIRADAPIHPGDAERTLYEQAAANSGFLAPGFLPLLTEASAPEASFPVKATFLNATPDLGAIVVNATARLTGPSSGSGLYEIAHGRVVFVSELPGGGPAPFSQLGFFHRQARALSDDGRRVVWTDSQQRAGHLYSRDTVAQETLRLDKAQGVAEPTTGEAIYQTASSDGSRVFFTDTQPLTPGSTSDPVKGSADLYECELAAGEDPTCQLRDLTSPIAAGEEARVEGSVLGASTDGSALYLVARGVLATNENASGEAARSGANNLYALHRDGDGWTTTFIASLANEDSPDWDEGETVVPNDSAFLTARVSPNGRYLAFMSKRSLTGYDNEDITSKIPGERIDQEVYLYDSSPEELRCVSCDPTGKRPAGVLDQEFSGEGLGLVADRRKIWAGQWLAGNIPGWTAQSINTALVQSRYLSNEGRLFFNGAGPLLPGVTVTSREEEISGKPETVGVENVYEYEPAGVGGCAAAGGCIALISSGSSPDESAFLEATPTGDDVFVITADRLQPQDTDTAFDVYDARICTASSPCLALAGDSPAPCETTDSCHGAGSPAPEFSSDPGTAGFVGPGTYLFTPPSHGVLGAQGSKHPTPKRPLTTAQKLNRALKACAKKYAHSAKRRKACESRARHRHAPKRGHK